MDNAIDASQKDVGATPPAQTYGYYNSVDVRTTQLRNLLAGTRPQVNPFLPDTTGQINGDTNFVYGSWPGITTGPGSAYTLPNGIADLADVASGFTDSSGQHPGSAHCPAGRRAMGRSGVGPRSSFTAPNSPPPLNLIQIGYANPVRAGYSFDPTDLLTAINNGTAYDGSGDPIFPRDAADDNYNAFDVFPPRITGEIGDLDFYDSAGALILPVERMRRFVTPVDINGSGSVFMWTTGGGSANKGYDNFGRVQFSSYFRPGGGAGRSTSPRPWTALRVRTPTAPSHHRTWSLHQRPQRPRSAREPGATAC